MEPGLPRPQLDPVEPEEDHLELGLSPRMIAAGWFACAACIPIIFLFVVLFGLVGRRLFEGLSGKDPLLAGIYVLLPISMAAFFGFLVGSRILNDRIVTGGVSAAIHGAFVAILSYCGSCLANAVFVASINSKESFEVIGSAFTVFVAGAILMGWLIILAGSFAGWQLFRYSNNSIRPLTTTWTTNRTAFRMNLWAAAMLLLVLFICWLPVLKLGKQESFKAAKRKLSDAVMQNNVAGVRELLASGVPVDTPDVVGATLLLSATQNGQTRIVKILLDQGANPNVTDIHDHRTPLHFAVLNFDVESIKALLDRGANINATDDYGGTALMEAASTTDRETVKFLIEHGADVNSESRDGRTALSLVRRDRDVAGNRDRAGEGMYSQHLDAGQNYGDSRDYQNPAIIERARARHDAIIELLRSYGAR